MSKPESTAENNKLSLFTKVSYGAGDLASQFVWSFIGSYLMIFYTDVAMLPTVAISTLFLVARIWDAVNDPMMGAIAERTKSKYGRFRPYILYGTPFLIIVYVLCFMAPSFGGNMTLKVIYAYVTYIALGMMYTLVNLPYGALYAVMSTDSGDRADLATWRMIGSNVGSLLLSAVSMPLILFLGKGDPSKPIGYTVTAIILGVIAIPLFYLVFFTSKEVVTVSEEAQKEPIWKSLKACVNRPFVCLTLAVLLSLIGKWGHSGVVMYYYRYVMQRTDLAAVLLVLLNGSTALGIFLFARLGKRYGLRRMTFISYLLAGITQISIYFISYDNVPLIMVMTVVSGLCRFGLPVANAMLPDVIDCMEARTRIRADGTACSVFSFGQKLASALVGPIGVVLLAASGYVANAVQTPQAMSGINFVVNIVPGVAWILALIPLMLYNITDEDLRKAHAVIDARK